MYVVAFSVTSTFAIAVSGAAKSTLTTRSASHGSVGAPSACGDDEPTMSRNDEASMLVVSYADVKRCAESCYSELVSREAQGG